MKWYLSKTFWFNAITLIVSLAAELSEIFPVRENPKLYITVITVGNLILRMFFTSKPIEE